MTEITDNQPAADEEEILKEEALVAEQQQATRESTALTLQKFLRILKFRLFNQGPRISAMWLFNILFRRLTGAPYRPYSQVTPDLFVGGQYWKRGWPAMASWGISAVVNLRLEYDDQKAGIAPERYLYLPTADDGAPALKQLQEGTRFIQDEISSGGKVYIHCGAGVGRAATMAAAYLVATGLTPDEAWKKIRAVRPFIRPSIQQVDRLEQFARLDGTQAGNQGHLS